MPEMSGYEMVEHAKRAKKDLGVIVLSGRESDGHGFPMVRKPLCLRIWRAPTPLFNVWPRYPPARVFPLRMRAAH
jgi:hypothetical protein